MGEQGAIREDDGWLSRRANRDAGDNEWESGGTAGSGRKSAGRSQERGRRRRDAALVVVVVRRSGVSGQNALPAPSAVTPASDRKRPSPASLRVCLTRPLASAPPPALAPGLVLSADALPIPPSDRPSRQSTHAPGPPAPVPAGPGRHGRHIARSLSLGPGLGTPFRTSSPCDSSHSVPPGTPSLFFLAHPTHPAFSVSSYPQFQPRPLLPISLRHEHPPSSIILSQTSPLGLDERSPRPSSSQYDPLSPSKCQTELFDGFRSSPSRLPLRVRFMSPSPRRHLALPVRHM